MCVCVCVFGGGVKVCKCQRKETGGEASVFDRLYT